MGHRRPEIDVERLRSLWAEETLTQAEIARELGLSHGQLDYCVRKAGLPRRAKRSRCHSMEHLTEFEIWRRAAIQRQKSLARMASETEAQTVKRLEREASRRRMEVA